MNETMSRTMGYYVPEATAGLFQLWNNIGIETNRYESRLRKAGG